MTLLLASRIPEGELVNDTSSFSPESKGGKRSRTLSDMRASTSINPARCTCPTVKAGSTGKVDERSPAEAFSNVETEAMVTPFSSSMIWA